MRRRCRGPLVCRVLPGDQVTSAEPSALVVGYLLLIMGFLILMAQLLTLYNVVIVVRVLISWVSPDPRNPVVLFLYKATEPVLAPLRRLLPSRVLGGIDLSPILAIVLISVLQALLRSLAFAFPA